VKYQSPSAYHLKVIGKVKVSDRMTDRTKTICPPIFDLGGIKMLQLMRISVIVMSMLKILPTLDGIFHLHDFCSK
jgi:hypothetical protein